MMIYCHIGCYNASATAIDVVAPNRVLVGPWGKAVIDMMSARVKAVDGGATNTAIDPSWQNQSIRQETRITKSAVSGRPKPMMRPS